MLPYYLAMTPRKYIGKVISKKYETPTIIGLEIVCLAPADFNFASGQFVNLKVGNTVYRAYSICSLPSEALNEGKFRIAVSAAHPGVGASYSAKLNVGDEVEFIGPSGRFELKSERGKNLCFVATSTGIAPFISMITRALASNLFGSVTLLFGVRNEAEALHADYISELKTKFKEFNYKICISQPISELSAPMYCGHVTDFIDKISLENTDFYVCGNNFMIEEITKYLVENGVSKEVIFTEPFYLK